MAVREFDGSDDVIKASGTGAAIFNGAYTVVGIIKYVTIAGDPIAFRSSGTYVASFGTSGGTKPSWNTLSSVTDAGFTTVDLTTWGILAVTKASGSTTGKMHWKPLGSGDWEQNAGGDTFGNIATSVNEAFFGNNGAGSFKDMRLGAAAVFNTELSDANIQSIDTTPSTQQLATLGATHLWDFNQASTATAVEDLVGDWDQTSITGTTVVGGDDPPSWTFGLAGAESAVVLEIVV